LLPSVSEGVCVSLPCLTRASAPWRKRFGCYIDCPRSKVSIRTVKALLLDIVVVGRDGGVDTKVEGSILRQRPHRALEPLLPDRAWERWEDRQ
jgi:hypothetical protein